jgi:hypothetical protein
LPRIAIPSSSVATNNSATPSNFANAASSLAADFFESPDLQCRLRQQGRTRKDYRAADHLKCYFTSPIKAIWIIAGSR